MMRLLAILLLIPSLAFSASVVLSNKAAYGGAGTYADPYSAEEVFYQGRARASAGGTVLYTYSAGDTFFLKGGTYYCPGGFYTAYHLDLAASGKPTSGNRLIIMPYGTEKVTFRPADSTASDEAGSIYVLRINVSYVTLYNLRFDLGNVTGSNSYHGMVEIATDNSITGTRVIHCAFLGGVQVVNRDQIGTTANEWYQNQFIHAGRSGWSNHGYYMYVQNNAANGDKTIDGNFFSNAVGDAAIHMYSESGNVDSFKYVRNMMVSSEANTYLVNGGYSYWLTGGTEVLVKTGLTTSLGIKIDTNIWFTGYNFRTLDGDADFAVLNFDKKASSARVRGNYFLRGYVRHQGAATMDNMVFTNNIHWADRAPISYTGSVDTGFAVHTGNRYWTTATTPSLADVIQLHKSKYESKRARLYVLNFDSSATVTIPSADLGTTFANGDTLRFVDLQNHPDSTWYSTVWNGSSDVTLTMPNGNASVYFPADMDLGWWFYEGLGSHNQHTDRRAAGFDILTGGALVEAGTPPDAPTATSATSITNGSFSANWNASSGATGYYLDVATNDIFTTFVSGYQNLSVGNVTTRSVTGLSGSTTYYYRVRAYNGDGASGSSNTITTATSADPAYRQRFPRKAR